MKQPEIRIILVEPAGALNVGSVARVMKNFGWERLILVNPQCDRTSDDARKMAVHAQDILESAVIVSTIPEALQGCQRVVATTGITHDWEAPLESPSQVLPWLLEADGQVGAIIFGREDRGLTNTELNYAQRFIRIPTNPEYPSLNLAMAVGLCCYELSQIPSRSFAVNQSLMIPSSHSSEPNPNLQSAPWEVVESYYQQLESLLLDIGYLYPHTAASRMEKFRQMYNRTQLRITEVAMLQGIIRQVRWVISNKNNRQNQ
ncbi:RNA methyltransferase [Calothrix sp. NIES-3974]|uniref:RNA methyltransferase n=1 Tax=Calothrix sp. NIES-3974 TaxID=2005462 RepID=UPI000B5EE09F|nr:RNA methyltransferase [Calothrix sp. NIES-3974]BAZ04412.1 TrmA family RNA methyltransferase [Calothrix sp. NIES-3974]